MPYRSRRASCPQCEEAGYPEHMIKVCAECGRPPALDGRCLCETQAHATIIEAVEAKKTPLL